MIPAMRERASGILLHPTSLPGRFAVGDLGPAAAAFLDWLRDAGQSWWQILPVGPPDAFGSPYSALSAFAGNPLLISPELLAEDGLVDARDLDGAPGRCRVDFGAAHAWKEPLLRRAWERFCAGRAAALGAELAELASTEGATWLDDWTLFEALRRESGGRGWWEWEPELARREPGAIAEARRRLAGETAYHAFVQLLFFRQWRRLRGEAASRGVRILGDLPIYVAWNSAEVWARPDLFDLDAAGRPRSVAGVPPDYFSETGQLWGNPLYRWDEMAREGYAWWVARLRANLRHADRVRLDHFRAFASFWKVGAGDETAIRGEWVEGPGAALFDALRDALGDLPIVAEDLGHVTPDVEELVAALGLPGMRVAQFGFEEPGSLHAIHRFERRCVVYTGTHDNDTLVGWYRGLGEEARRRLDDYCGVTSDRDREEVHWHVIRALLTSVADLAVLPAQDVLGLDSSARMNRPSVPEGNWTWRLEEGQLTGALAARLARLTEVSERSPS
jgi:4-alpha-glucanotransferase